MMMIATQMFALISVKNIILGGGRDRACAHARINWGHCGADSIIAAIATAALYKEVAYSAVARQWHTLLRGSRVQTRLPDSSAAG